MIAEVSLHRSQNGGRPSGLGSAALSIGVSESGVADVVNFT